MKVKRADFASYFAILFIFVIVFFWLRDYDYIDYVIKEVVD